MSAVIFSGNSVKALKGKLNLADNSVLDGTSITAGTVIISDNNKNILSSNIAASALNSITGTVSANQIAFSNGTSLTGTNQLEWTASSNTFSVSGNIQYVGAVIFTESQATSANLTDNANTQIVSASTATYNSFKLLYSVTRGTSRRIGEAYVIQSGASADLSGSFGEIGNCGLTLTASVIGGNVGISGILTSTGINATFSYKIINWLG